MIRTVLPVAISCVLMGSLTDSPKAFGQYNEEATVQAATSVLREAMATPGNAIPAAMLENCYGVAIIPNVIKGGFVVGARHGRGLLFVREANGVWHAPVFITLTGGNIGWQVGVQSSDIILVFKTQKSVQGILSGKLTLGADAAAAAGPVGRETAAATDGQLKAEIYTYSRSRGLFAGVSIDGSVVRVDQLATGAYYHSAGPGQPVTIPPSAQALTQQIAAYASPSGSIPPAGATVPGASAAPNVSSAPGITPSTAAVPYQAPLVQQHRSTESDVLRKQLTELSPELYEIVDAQWKSYLALPSSLFLTETDPTPAELATTVSHFNRVATDPAFAQLAARPEFQSVYGILKHYEQSLSATPSAVQLPPPPTNYGAPPIR